jgi:hypothetical protein
MIDLIEKTKPVTAVASHRAIPLAAVLCHPVKPKAHDGAVLAALAVSFGTVLVCR